MSKQEVTIFQAIGQFAQKFTSNPFCDFYVLLIFRFVVYIYLFIKLSDIMLGHVRPNLRTRVLRKFKFVYGEQILKELDNYDMQQLQRTINNTILNATQDFSINNNSRSRVAIVMSSEQTAKEGLSSERKSLRNDKGSQTSKPQLGKRPQKHRITFDLDRNDYYPLHNNYHIASGLQIQQNKMEEIEARDQFQVQQQCQEQELSPKHRVVKCGQSPYAKQQEQNILDVFQLHSQSYINKIQLKSHSDRQRANTHYPVEQVSGMDLGIEVKLTGQQSDPLHFSNETLHKSLIRATKDQNFNLPSAIKSKPVNTTQSYLDQLST